MEKIISEGKTFEEALESLSKDNNLKEEEVVYRKEEVKGKLFKSDSIVLTAYKKEDIYELIKDFLKELINNLGLDVSFEIKNNEDHPIIKMYSDNNPILIGKNGQTIQALETIVKQRINNEIGVPFKVTLDVENYKDKKDNRIIRLARQTAKDVAKTKIPVTMDNMTSYERRLIHNALTDFRGVTCHSEGEEPNRHIIIEPEK